MPKRKNPSFADIAYVGVMAAGVVWIASGIWSGGAWYLWLLLIAVAVGLGAGVVRLRGSARAPDDTQDTQ